MTMHTAEKTKSKNGKTSETAKHDAPTVENAPASAGTTPGSVDTKALWAEIRVIEAEAQRVQAEMDKLAEKRSGVLGQLQQSLGSGPFQVAGLGLVNIRSRKSKVEGKPDTYFFVSIGTKSVTVIE